VVDLENVPQILAEGTLMRSGKVLVRPSGEGIR
jgi:hypothetical protein